MTAEARELPQIIWHSEPVTGEELAQVERELRDLFDGGLQKPSDLIFHHINFDDDFERGRFVAVWGKHRSPYLHAQLHPARKPPVPA